ncbi:MAG: vWA domain-containing protein [Granulosicoccus sp.]
MTLSSIVRRLFSLPNLPFLLALLLLLSTALLKPITLQQPVYSYQIGFDISQSMNVSDVTLDGQSVTRLAYAKSMAKSLLQQLPCGSSVGWSVFTGRRTLTLITPLEVCEHYSGLMASLAEVDGTMRWSNGSSIGKGIHQIMRAADDFDEPTSIILMTDGQEAPPLEQGQRGLPKTEHFEVNGLLVGVGGETPVPIPKTDLRGQPIGFWSAEDVVQRVPAGFSAFGEEFSKRDDERLLSLARLTQLEYVTLDSARNLTKSALQTDYAQHRPTLTDVRWIPASVALLLLLWKFIPKYSDLAGSKRFRVLSIKR